MCTLFVFCQLDYFETHPSCCMYQEFLFIANVYYIVWIDHNWFIHFSVDGHLGCFYFGAITNKVAMYFSAYVWSYTFISLA